MKSREFFFITGIISTIIGFYYILFLKSIWIRIGLNPYEISIISDGIFFVLMGVAIVMVSSRKWDSEERK